MKKTLLRIITICLAGTFTYLVKQYDEQYTVTTLSVDTFALRHAQDMNKKKEKTTLLSGSVSSTLELLEPSNKENIITQEVAYASGVVGFLAYPEANPNAPGVVLIHERWGLNEHIEDMARVLAMHGYRALAVDLYNGQVAGTSDEAMKLMQGLDQEQATQNLLAAEAYLRKESTQVASLGRCLGGAQSLQLSLASNTLDATIIYYGRLVDDPELLSKINTPVLGIFAENDSGIPPSAVNAFTDGLTKAGIDSYDITIYPNVDHAFANPTGGNYEKEATIDAWEKTLDFLQKTLPTTPIQEDNSTNRLTYTDTVHGFAVDYPEQLDTGIVQPYALENGVSILGDDNPALRFVVYAYQTEDDIQGIVKEHYGSNYCVWMDPPYVFSNGVTRNVIDARQQEDEEADIWSDGEGCFLNYITQFNVYPDQKKIMTVDIGQDLNACKTTIAGKQVCYDDKIIESFRWLE